MKTIIDKDSMWLAFKALGQPALAMNHYDLSMICPDFTVEEWKQFLSEEDVKASISAEMELIRKSEINKMVTGAGDSNSVGKAQLLNSLLKTNETTAEKNGPTFVYCHVPLNEQQRYASNVLECDEFGNIIT